MMARIRGIGLGDAALNRRKRAMLTRWTIVAAVLGVMSVVWLWRTAPAAAQPAPPPALPAVAAPAVATQPATASTPYALTAVDPSPAVPPAAPLPLDSSRSAAAVSSAGVSAPAVEIVGSAVGAAAPTMTPPLPAVGDSTTSAIVSTPRSRVASIAPALPAVAVPDVVAPVPVPPAIPPISVFPPPLPILGAAPPLLLAMTVAPDTAERLAPVGTVDHVERSSAAQLPPPRPAMRATAPATTRWSDPVAATGRRSAPIADALADIGVRRTTVTRAATEPDPTGSAGPLVAPAPVSHAPPVATIQIHSQVPGDVPAGAGRPEAPAARADRAAINPAEVLPPAETTSVSFMTVADASPSSAVAALAGMPAAAVPLQSGALGDDGTTGGELPAGSTASASDRTGALTGTRAPIVNADAAPAAGGAGGASGQFPAYLAAIGLLATALYLLGVRQPRRGRVLSPAYVPLVPPA